MTHPAKSRVTAIALLSTTFLTGCVVSQSDYDALQAKNNQLQQQVAADQQQIARLQGAIKYTVNSDLLFAPGSWKIKPQGESGDRQPGEETGTHPAESLDRERLHRQCSDRSCSSAGGCYLQSGAIPETCGRCDAISDLPGRQTRADLGTGVWRCESGCFKRYRPGSGAKPAGRIVIGRPSQLTRHSHRIRSDLRFSLGRWSRSLGCKGTNRRQGAAYLKY